MNEKTLKMKEIIKECGRIMAEADRSGMRIDSKAGSANFVTEYDTKVQAYLQERLKEVEPDAGFIGEEGSKCTFSPKGKFFIADPIDGTTNFIKDYRVSCVSVALVEDGTVQTGMVYNPYMDELFWAERGKGAFCNDERIHVSDQPLSNGIVLFGTSPYNDELNEASFKLAYEYFKQALDIRRSGSAALDLCYVAAGRAELYFEMKLYPWDYAAGSLLIEEAGGKISTIEGEEIRFDRQCSILARN